MRYGTPLGCQRVTLAQAEEKAHSAERDLRNVGDQDERDQVDHQKRNDAAIDRAQLEPEHGLGNEDVHAERRMEQADRQIHGHHDAEMHGVDAERLDYGHQQRRQQQDRRQRIEEAADRQQDDVNRQQKHPARNVERLQPSDDRRGNLIDGQQPGENSGAGDNDENLRREYNCGGGGLDDIAPTELAKNKPSDEGGIDAGDRRRLGRREHAAIDAAENDERHAERPDAAHGRMQEMIELERLAGADAVAPGKPHDIGREHERQHQARHHAGRIESRYRFLGRCAVDDHRNTGRDDDVDRTDRGDQAGGEVFRIARPPHRRIHDAANGGDTGRADAGDRAEYRRSSHRGDGEAATHRADAGLDKIDQALGDAAAPHQFAGIDEKRNRQQREGIDRSEHGLMQRRDRHVHEEHERDADRRQQNDNDRESQQQQNNRHHAERERHGSGLRAGFAAVRRAPGQDLNKAQASDECHQTEAHRDRAMRNPHRHLRHVAHATDVEHLLGIIGRIPQHKGGENDDRHEFGNFYQPADRRRQRVYEHVHAQMLITPGDHGGAEEGHEHHDEDLQLVGTEYGAAEAVAANDVDEVEGDRVDEGISERVFDPPR